MSYAKQAGVRGWMSRGGVAAFTAISALLTACGAPVNTGEQPASDEHRLLSSYWGGVDRAIATTPYGNRAAIVRHNCYHATSLSSTRTRIASAINEGADAIELDVTLHADGALHVEHNDSEDAQSPLLADVLAYPAFANANALLFIEVKEAFSASNGVAEDLLLHLVNGPYARAGRPVAIRAFANRSAYLDQVRALLAQDSRFAAIRDHVRLQMLVNNSNNPEGYLQSMVDVAVQNGYHAIEFDYHHRNLFSGIAYARAQGLGVNLWTINNNTHADILISAFRDEVDAITTDYSPAAARAAVQAQNGLLYFNAADQTGTNGVVRYYRTTSTAFTTPINAAGAPGFEFLSQANEDRYGGSLVFTGAEAARFYDGDNASGEGFLVTALVNFDQLTLPEGETASILAKSHYGGFALELHNPPGDVPTLLRYGVRVGGAYVYASRELDGLNNDDSYFLIGSYDGASEVRLYVDDTLAGASPTSGGVERNNVPILAGADPEGATGARFFFKGKTQQVSVQSYGAR